LPGLLRHGAAGDQKSLDERVEVAIQHALGIADLESSPQVLHQLQDGFFNRFKLSFDLLKTSTFSLEIP